MGQTIKSRSPHPEQQVISLICSKRAVLVKLCTIIICVGLVCYCHHGAVDYQHCFPNDTCTGAVGCTLTRDLVEDNGGQISESILYDCLNFVLEPQWCNTNTSSRRRACCYDTDLCNLWLIVEPFLQVTTMNPSELATPPVIGTGT